MAKVAAVRHAPNNVAQPGGSCAAIQQNLWPLSVQIFLSSIDCTPIQCFNAYASNTKTKLMEVGE